MIEAKTYVPEGDPVPHVINSIIAGDEKEAFFYADKADRYVHVTREETEKVIVYEANGQVVPVPEINKKPLLNSVLRREQSLTGVRVTFENLPTAVQAALQQTVQ